MSGHRTLFAQLVRRELRRKYKGSSLGALWYLINPLVLLGAYTLMFGHVFRLQHFADFPIFLMIGLMAWTFFAQSLLAAAESLITRAASCAGRASPERRSPLLLLPVLVALWFCFALGCALIVSVLHAYFRDVAPIVSAALLPWFFITPIFRAGHDSVGAAPSVRRDAAISHAHRGSIAGGNLENVVQEAMVRHLGRGGVFYDVGANLGFFSLLGAHLSGLDAGRVVAFEAAPDNAEAIRVNAALNRIANVEVICAAVTDHSGSAQLQVVDDQSWSKLVQYGEHPFTERVIDVTCVAIDELVRTGRVPPPTAIKIDVEGAELDVLAGMRETIAAHEPAIICELHDTHTAFVEAMDACGYRVINLEGTVPMRDAGASAHALALPARHPGD